MELNPAKAWHNYQERQDQQTVNAAHSPIARAAGVSTIIDGPLAAKPPTKEAVNGDPQALSPSMRRLCAKLLADKGQDMNKLAEQYKEQAAANARKQARVDLLKDTVKKII